MRHADGRMKRRRGSLALLFCLVVAASLICLHIFIQATRLRAAELDLARAMEAQAERCLAAYDPDARTIGLFAFAPQEPDKQLFAALCGGARPLGAITLLPQEPITGHETLRAQIIRCMRSRVPLVALNELFTRLPDFGLQADAESGGMASLVSGFCSALDEERVGTATSQLFGTLLDPLQDKITQLIEAAYRRWAIEVLGCPPSGPLHALAAEMPDFLDPQSISRFAGQVDQLLCFETSPAYEKICLVEYILGYFRPSVAIQITSSGKRQLATISHIPYAEMPADREAEIEKILTGQTSADSASLSVRTILTAIRSLIRFASTLADAQQMAALRAAAAALSVGFAALSAGTVTIDPQIMLYLLITSQAIEAGCRDAAALLEGRPVPLWPGRNGPVIELFYQDHLRILLYFCPQAQLIERLAKQVAAILSKPLYVRIQVSAQYLGRTWRTESAYAAAITGASP